LQNNFLENRVAQNFHPKFFGRKYFKVGKSFFQKQYSTRNFHKKNFLVKG